MLAPMAMALRQQGVPVKIVYLGHRDGSALMVHKDSGIRDFEGLRGKRVAVPNRFSNQYLMIFKALKDRGMTQKDIELVEMPPPDMPAALYAKAVDAIISGDVFALERAVRNLVENAIRHTPGGEQILIRVAVHSKEASVQVIDAGVGIAAEHQPQLFERFFRVDRSRSREVDLVFVINNSPSMAAHQSRIAANLSRFRQLFHARDLDYRIGVLTTDFVNVDPSRSADRQEFYTEVRGTELDRTGQPVLDRRRRPKPVTKQVASNGALVTLSGVPS